MRRWSLDYGAVTGGLQEYGDFGVLSSGWGLKWPKCLKKGLEIVSRIFMRGWSLDYGPVTGGLQE